MNCKAKTTNSTNKLTPVRKINRNLTSKQLLSPTKSNNYSPQYKDRSQIFNRQENKPPQKINNL